ncbi:glycosyltransferase family 4 protein [Micromonospora siamensis]|uniref:Glycosyl transferases group 1 n=1 Tax=Micromonospora siamensis TaxID=299152 RepID=A0A1C5HZD1_9ACTN|nr:glycosyltransferase [Micromonospora siamensis]SCG51345.1 Glycosyl transferases group 1 [Micromonospora siamensis]
MKRAIFWQNCPSIHQTALIRSVGDVLGTPSVVVIEAPLDQRRLGAGWTMPDYGDSTVIVAPSAAERRRLEEASADSAMHVFSGLGAYPQTTGSMVRLAPSRRAGGSVSLVYVEPWPESLLRDVKYRFARLRHRGTVDGVLACGRAGVEQYRRIGFGASRVFEFGYFLDVADACKYPDVGAGAGGTGPVRLVFVGRLDGNKRLNWALKALSVLRDRDWRLDVVGTGPRHDELTRLADELHVGDRVRWHGVLPNHEVNVLLAASDVLVLPSRYDGWGAVVNEALGAGTPAIVSDAAGSAALVAGGARGSVFSALSLDSLRRALLHHLDEGPVDPGRRADIRSWAAHRASAPAAATYLLEIAASVRSGGPVPAPPWRMPPLEAGPAAGWSGGPTGVSF